MKLIIRRNNSIYNIRRKEIIVREIEGVIISKVLIIIIIKYNILIIVVIQTK